MFLVAAQLFVCAMRTALSSSCLNWHIYEDRPQGLAHDSFHPKFLPSNRKCSLQWLGIHEHHWLKPIWHMPGGFCISMLTHSAVAFSIQAALCCCSYRPAQPSVHRLISPHGTKSREAACQEVRVQGRWSEIEPKEGFQEGHRELQDIYLQGKMVSRS